MKHHFIQSLILILSLISQISFAQQADPESSTSFSDQWGEKLEHLLFDEHDSEKHTHRECLTAFWMEGIAHKDQLSPRLQKILELFEDRPTELELTTESAHFKFHYTLSGQDAVDPTDNNNTGIPDYVEFMASSFEEVYEFQINELGYVAPPSDNGEGGSDKYDVYISDIARGVYGYVIPENQIGDNPNSAVREGGASTSWMAMRNNYDDFALGLESVKVTAAHEYFHAVQMGYNIDFGFESPTNFVFEATATWMEDEAYPGLDDNLQYLEFIFNDPDVALNYNFNDDRDPSYNNFQNYWYGTWLFFRFVTERHGRDVVRKTWENIRDTDEISAFKQALTTENTTFLRVFEDYVVANLVLSENPSFAPFAYGRAGDYITFLVAVNQIDGVRVEGNINLNQNEVRWDSDNRGNSRLMRLSSDYFKINNAPSSITATLSTNLNELGVQLIKIDNSSQRITQQKVYASSSEQEVEVSLDDISPNDEIYAIVYRMDETNTDFDSDQYSLKISGEGLVSGVEDRLQENEFFEVAPNPVSSQMRFTYNLNNNDYQVKVLDVLGREILNTPLHKQSLSTSSWKNGLYVVVLISNSQPIATRKIVVTK